MKATIGANVWYQWMELTTQSGQDEWTRSQVRDCDLHPNGCAGLDQWALPLW
jgi:hypothetical protein